MVVGDLPGIFGAKKGRTVRQERHLVSGMEQDGQNRVPGTRFVSIFDRTPPVLNNNTEYYNYMFTLQVLQYKTWIAKIIYGV